MKVSLLQINKTDVIINYFSNNCIGKPSKLVIFY